MWWVVLCRLRGGVPPLRSSASRYSWASLRPWPRGARSWSSSRTPSLRWSPCAVLSYGRGRFSPWTAVALLGPWLAGDPERSVHLWFVPSRMEWGAQKAAHDVVVSLKIAVGRRPRTSRDFLRQRADVAASKDWCELFKDPSYRGHSFLDLLNSKDKPLQPSTRKGGPWLSESRVGPSTFSRLCRCITGHAPLGAYRQRFQHQWAHPLLVSCRAWHLGDKVPCSALVSPVETPGPPLIVGHRSDFDESLCRRTQPSVRSCAPGLPGILDEGIAQGV
jgi:hypothetical protein